MNSRKKFSMIEDFTTLGTVGIELSVWVLICGGIGYWIDNKLRTSPGFTTAGLIIGLAAGLYRTYTVIVKSDIWESNDQKKEDQSSDDNKRS